VTSSPPLHLGLAAYKIFLFHQEHWQLAEFALPSTNSEKKSSSQNFDTLLPGISLQILQSSIINT